MGTFFKPQEPHLNRRTLMLHYTKGTITNYTLFIFFKTNTSAHVTFILTEFMWQRK